MIVLRRRHHDLVEQVRDERLRLHEQLEVRALMKYMAPSPRRRCSRCRRSSRDRVRSRSCGSRRTTGSDFTRCEWAPDCPYAVRSPLPAKAMSAKRSVSLSAWNSSIFAASESFHVQPLAVLAVERVEGAHLAVVRQARDSASLRARTVAANRPASTPFGATSRFATCCSEPSSSFHDGASRFHVVQALLEVLGALRRLAQPSFSSAAARSAHRTSASLNWPSRRFMLRPAGHDDLVRGAIVRDRDVRRERLQRLEAGTIEHHTPASAGAATAG